MGSTGSVLLPLAIALPIRSRSDQEADLVLMNGAVYTVEEAQPWARGLAVKGNSILAVFDEDSGPRPSSDRTLGSSHPTKDGRPGDRSDRPKTLHR